MAKSAFDIEIKRQKLAVKGKIEELRRLYEKGTPEIKDSNNSKFWDHKYKDYRSLEEQDPITRDRVKTALSFISKGEIKILDIGAGMGWVEEVLSKDKEIYANDFSLKAVNYLKKNFKGNFSIQSIYNLNYPNNFFDAILVLEVLEHIPPGKTFKILSSINKLLKEKGFLIISVPMNEGLENMEDNPNSHVRMYTEDLIKAELQIAGFKAIKYKTLFAFNSLYSFKTIVAKLFKTHKPNNIVIKAIKK